MNWTRVALVLGVAAAVTSTSLYAGDHRKTARDSRRTDSGMLVVVHSATVGQPGHLWRYFADARRGRAVAISPGGDYFYSDGGGLTLVHKGTTGANAG